MNKKGDAGLIVGIVLVLFIIGTFIYYYTNTYPTNKPLCEKEYKQYELNSCINNLREIRLCERFNATYVSIEQHFFSGNEVVCYKDGGLLKI